MEEFKRHEEKMKHYQQSKRTGHAAARPPLAQSNPTGIQKETSQADLQITLPHAKPKQIKT
jgi:hypothetical protein